MINTASKYSHASPDIMLSYSTLALARVGGSSLNGYRTGFLKTGTSLAADLVSAARKSRKLCQRTGKLYGDILSKGAVGAKAKKLLISRDSAKQLVDLLLTFEERSHN